MPKRMRVNLSQVEEVVSFPVGVSYRAVVCHGRLNADPAPTGVGDTYYNTVDGKWYAFNGASWDALN